MVIGWFWLTETSVLPGRSVDARAVASNRRPHTTTTWRTGAKETERRVDGPSGEMDGHHLTLLNRVIAMICHADVNMVVKDERRGIPDLLVQLGFATTAETRDPGDSGDFPNLSPGLSVQGKSLPLPRPMPMD